MLSEVAGTAKDAPPTISHGYARTSDHQGRFTFRGVPAGRYTLRATRVPPPFLAGVPSEVFQVADGQTFDAGFVRLRRGGAISGRITDERGMPVTNMPVAAIRVSTSDPAARRYDAQPTDDRGHFRIYGLEDDDYYVIAQPPRGAAAEADAQEEAPAADSFVPTLHPSATDPAAAVRVRVRAGEDVLDIDIRIAEGRLARLRGRLIDSRGAPLPGTLGYVTHASNRVTRFPGIGFNTDDQGRFEIAGLWPGNYRLSARTLPDFSSDAANRRPTDRGGEYASARPAHGRARATPGNADGVRRGAAGLHVRIERPVLPSSRSRAPHGSCGACATSVRSRHARITVPFLPGDRRMTAVLRVTQPDCHASGAR